MARLTAPASTGWRVLVIDDDADLLTTTLSLLRREGHAVEGCADPLAGVEKVRTWRPHLVLLDFYMPRATGAEVCAAIRAFDPLVQLVLVTGYAGEQPARRMMAELDIQGYHDKADGPERLLVQVDAALKQAATLGRIEAQRRLLQQVVDDTPRLARLQPAESFFRQALDTVGRLLGGVEGVVATRNSGLFLLPSAREAMSVRVGTGRFEGVERLGDLPADLATLLRATLDDDLPRQHGDLVTVPLATRDGARGCMALAGVSLVDDAVAAVRIVAGLVALAFENLRLYEQATSDHLTGLHNRAFGERRLNEYVTLAARSGHRTSVLLVDLDHFKAINDGFGHAAGDVALCAVARALEATCRASDICCRFGGEEFLIVLPETGLQAAAQCAERVRRALGEVSLRFEGQPLAISASIGVAEVGPDEHWARTIERADAALYAAKRAGRDRVCVAR
ncbi:MAG: diguanylate cyclase [Myxococcales bacterium]|nr:diguanylate cyclase [Myxococcales bacterium]